MRRIFFLAGLVCLAGLTAWDQDPAKVEPKHIKVEFENDQVRVLRYVYPPYYKSPLHDHPSNVQILLTDADAKVTTGDGKTAESHGKAGEVRWRLATKHMVENMGDKPFEGILVELKGKPAATN